MDGALLGESQPVTECFCLVCLSEVVSCGNNLRKNNSMIDQFSSQHSSCWSVEEELA